MMNDESGNHATRKESLRVGVLLGGWSDEREISLKTGQAITKALIAKGWEVIPIDVDRNVCDRIKHEGIDVAFLALHGRFGEDGTIQGVLEMMGIPYTGSGVLASSVAIHKIFTKIVLQHAGIPTPLFVPLGKTDGPLEESPFGYPVVVKPATQGSTIGIHIVNGRSELKDAVADAFGYDDAVLVEEYVPGRELTVGILGTEPLPVLEIVPRSGFYDFQAKYTHGQSEYRCPAPLSEDIAGRVQELGAHAFRALGCRDFSRVDFRLREDGSPFCLEINTIPGMTDTSLLPKAALVQGIQFPELVERILLMALARRNDLSERKGNEERSMCHGCCDKGLAMTTGGKSGGD